MAHVLIKYTTPPKSDFYNINATADTLHNKFNPPLFKDPLSFKNQFQILHLHHCLKDNIPVLSRVI